MTFHSSSVTVSPSTRTVGSTWSMVTALTLYGLGSQMFFIAPAIAIICLIAQVFASRYSGAT